MVVITAFVIPPSPGGADGDRERPERVRRAGVNSPLPAEMPEFGRSLRWVLVGCCSDLNCLIRASCRTLGVEILGSIDVIMMGTALLKGVLDGVAGGGATG